MKCTKCGFELDEHANFCSNCGTPVVHEPETVKLEETVTPVETTASEVNVSKKEDAKTASAGVDDLDLEFGEPTEDPEDTSTVVQPETQEEWSVDRSAPVYAELDDDDDEDYDDFAYEERRAKRQARKAKKARDKMILLGLVGVILVGAVAFVVVKSLNDKDGKVTASKAAPSSSVVSEVQNSKSIVSGSVVPTEDPNKMSAEELNAAVTTIQQQYEAIMAKRTAGEYKASAYKTGITAYWDGDSKISAIVADSGTEGSQYTRSYYYDDNGNLIYADLSGADAYRLYFKDGELVRLSYAKDANNAADVTNYDQADSQEYTDWQTSALDYSTTLMTEAKAAGIVKSQEEIDAEKAAEEERQKEEEAQKKKEEEAKKKAEEEEKAEEEKKKKEEEDKKEETSSNSKKSGGYVFADSDSEYIAESDLDGLSKTKVRRAVNEIYARRGAKFDSKSNQEYFESKSWYKGTCSKSEAEKKFNKYEKQNVATIVAYEKSKGWR